jgi:hypothetical protein
MTAFYRTNQNLATQVVDMMEKAWSDDFDQSVARSKPAMFRTV